MFFAIISYSGLSSATLLHVYLGNLPKETPVRDNFAIFFIWMLMNKGRLVKLSLANIFPSVAER